MSKRKKNRNTNSSQKPAVQFNRQNYSDRVQVWMRISRDVDRFDSMIYQPNRPMSLGKIMDSLKSYYSAVKDNASLREKIQLVLMRVEIELKITPQKKHRNDKSNKKGVDYLQISPKDLVYKDGVVVYFDGDNPRYMHYDGFKEYYGSVVKSLDDGYRLSVQMLPNNEMKIRHIDKFIAKLKSVEELTVEGEYGDIRKTDNGCEFEFEGTVFRNNSSGDNSVTNDAYTIFILNLRNKTFNWIVGDRIEEISWDNVDFGDKQMTLRSGSKRVAPKIVECSESKSAYNLIKTYIAARLPKIKVKIEHFVIVDVMDLPALSKALRTISQSSEYAEVADPTEPNEIVPYREASQSNQEYVLRKLVARKSQYLEWLQTHQSKRYKIIPAVECSAHRADDFIGYEDAFIFTIEHNGIVDVVYENVEYASRASIICRIERSEHKKFCEALYNYMGGTEKNKREAIRRGKILFWQSKNISIRAVNHVEYMRDWTYNLCGIWE